MSLQKANKSNNRYYYTGMVVNGTLCSTGMCQCSRLGFQQTLNFWSIINTDFLLDLYCIRVISVFLSAMIHNPTRSPSWVHFLMVPVGVCVHLSRYVYVSMYNVFVQNKWKCVQVYSMVVFHSWLAQSVWLQHRCWRVRAKFHTFMPQYLALSNAHIRPMSRSVNVHLVAHFLNNNSHTVCEQTRSKTSLLLWGVSVMRMRTAMTWGKITMLWPDTFFVNAQRLCESIRLLTSYITSLLKKKKKRRKIHTCTQSSSLSITESLICPCEKIP